MLSLAIIGGLVVLAFWCARSSRVKRGVPAVFLVFLCLGSAAGYAAAYVIYSFSRFANGVVPLTLLEQGTLLLAGMAGGLIIAVLSCGLYLLACHFKLLPTRRQ